MHPEPCAVAPRLTLWIGVAPHHAAERWRRPVLEAAVAWCSKRGASLRLWFEDPTGAGPLLERLRPLAEGTTPVDACFALREDHPPPAGPWLRSRTAVHTLGHGRLPSWEALEGIDRVVLRVAPWAIDQLVSTVDSWRGHPTTLDLRPDLEFEWDGDRCEYYGQELAVALERWLARPDREGLRLEPLSSLLSGRLQVWDADPTCTPDGLLHPWVDAAHTHGAPSIGSVFTDDDPGGATLELLSPAGPCAPCAWRRICPGRRPGLALRSTGQPNRPGAMACLLARRGLQATLSALEYTMSERSNMAPSRLAIGADGAVYWIPNELLETFRVGKVDPPDQAPSAPQPVTLQAPPAPRPALVSLSEGAQVIPETGDD